MPTVASIRRVSLHGDVVPDAAMIRAPPLPTGVVMPRH